MVKYQGFFKQPFILFPITFLLVFFLSFPWVNAQNVTKPKPQQWQINGILAALDDDYDEVKGYALSQLARYEAKDLKTLLKKPEDVAEKAGKILRNKSVDSYIRSSAARALGNMGDAAKPHVKDIVDILKDKSVESYIRASAAYALGNMGDIAKPYIKDILDLIKDKSVESHIRSSVAEALRHMGDANKPYLQNILDLIEDKSVELNIRITAVLLLSNMGDIAKPYIKKIVDILKDESVNSDARTTAAFALGDMGDAAKPYIKEIFNLIKDESVESNVRSSAIYVLSNMGDAAKPYIKEIFDFIKDESIDSNLRSSAASALGNMGDAAKPYIKEIFNLIKDKSVDSDVRSIAVSALGNLGDTAKPYVKDILNLIKDKSVDSNVRSSAVSALENLGDAAKPYFKDILNLIKDKSVEPYARSSAAQALGNIQQLNLEEIVIILDNVYYAGESSSFDPTGFDNWRFFTYFLSGGTNEVKTLLKWTGYPKKLPDKITHNEAVKTLKTFGKVWQSTQDLTRLRNDLARKIAIVAKKASWKPQDIVLLEQHYRNLKQARYNEADTLQSVIVNLKGWQWLFKFRKIILIHAAFWLLLIFAYPKSPQIQAIFFWNPWVRRIFGMGYVGFLLAWIPFLRHKLFQPFQPSLLADAGLNNFDERVYFPESGITETQNITSSSKITPIFQAIPHIQGEIVLEGDSGLGKSMFLRYLVKTSKRIIVYLPARKCEKGVIEAIQNKLHGQAQDAQFLKNLIYSGAIDICIDGLNEVTADTRAQIKQFVESYFRGNIIITTQPLEWEPPSTAKTYYLQPLQQSQIQQFLYSRQPHLPHDAKIKGSDYEKNCDRYLNESFNTKQTPEELTAVKRILSNPMDLTLIALMLSQGEHPDVFHLQQQQYNLMAEEYQRFWQQDFPLKQFSEAVYQMRLNDESALPDDEFYNELICMEDEKYKMVVSRQWEDCDDEACKEWYFRHDKIMDYFIVQTFLGDSNDAESRLIDNIGDPRFRGVYFLLATLLPLNQAKDLREKLINYAADTKDHTVSDTFVQLLRTR
ncbi:MAG: HEAT repeat domain-containing protein [Rivularia sp. (in: cyanobacteria)]